MPPTGRLLTEKHAALAAFAARSNDGRTWVQAMKDYNKESSQDTRYMDPRDFRRDSRAAYRRVMGVDLEWGNPRITDSRKERMRKAAQDIGLFEKRLKRSSPSAETHSRRRLGDDDGVTAGDGVGDAVAISV